MRRFGRWVFNGLTMLLLLLGVTTAVLWVRGHRLGDVAWISIRNQNFGLNSSNGELLLSWSLDSEVVGGAHWRMYDLGSYDISRDPCRYVALGFGVDAYAVHHSGRATIRDFSLLVPDWFLLLLFSLLALRLIRHRTTHAARCSAMGMCAKCGYDLRATPDRCPECGTVQAKTKIPT